MFLAHAIRLRDPWRCEPTNEGGLRWSRIFHRPTGLEADDDLWLVITGLPPAAKVTVNGHEFVPTQQNAPAPSPFEGRDQTSTGDPKSPERSTVVRREATGEGGRAGTRYDHPSLTLPIKGRGPEDSSVEPQKAPDPFRADLTPILADANRIQIELPPAACASAELAEVGLAPKDAFPYDARLAIVGRS